MSKSTILENYARMVTDIASENLGEEIVLLDTGEISLFSEFSILITGQTDRHLESLSQKIMREMKKSGNKIHHKEGSGKTGWILLDYFGLSVHILLNEKRKDENGKPIYNDSGKVMKGPNYFKPDLSKFVN